MARQLQRDYSDRIQAIYLFIFFKSTLSVQTLGFKCEVIILFTLKWT